MKWTPILTSQDRNRLPEKYLEFMSGCPRSDQLEVPPAYGHCTQAAHITKKGRFMRAALEDRNLHWTKTYKIGTAGFEPATP
jgi:hypothetical protein